MPATPEAYALLPYVCTSVTSCLYPRHLIPSLLMDVPLSPYALLPHVSSPIALCTVTCVPVSHYAMLLHTCTSVALCTVASCLYLIDLMSVSLSPTLCSVTFCMCSDFNMCCCFISVLPVALWPVASCLYPCHLISVPQSPYAVTSYLYFCCLVPCHLSFVHRSPEAGYTEDVADWQLLVLNGDI